MTAQPDGCPICRILEGDERRIMATSFWDVRLAHQQMRPGRCMTILKRHAQRETDLTEEEWLDLRALRQRLHPAILRAFGATHLNTSILMNGAFKNYGTSGWGKSHVHYWDVPRYLEPVRIGELTFDDPSYPQLNPREYLDERKEVPEAILATIISTLQSDLGP